MPLARRQLLTLGAAALAAPAFIRHARAADVPRFELGVASGHPEPEAVVLWTRLTGLDLPAAVPVHWALAEDEAFSRIAASGTENAVAADAHSVHAEPRGLDPGRGYFYRFSALGRQSETGRTRTAPAADAPASLRAVVASCQRFDHGQWAAWRHAATQDVDLVMFLGDYIYEYASGPQAVRQHDGPPLRTLAQYRARYAQYKGDPALQAAHAAAPWLLIWDDHEVDNDYANDQGQWLQGAAFLRQRAAAYQAWWEHQPVPKAMRPAGPDARIFHRLDWGRLARIHAVDNRQYRSTQACVPAFSLLGRNGMARSVSPADCAELRDPARTLLGAAQERWLADGWDLDRPWNLLAQQTLMARASRSPVTGPDSGTYWSDGWDGYPAARQRLLQAVVDRRVPGMVALGGDVHAHFVAGLKTDFDDPKSPVVASEFCTTSISSNGAPQALIDAMLPHNPHLLYGRSDQRGYVALTIDEQQLRAELMAVRRPQDALSPVDVAARFVVDPRQPGPQRA
jgi:alkaline phosphatase D